MNFVKYSDDIKKLIHPKGEKPYVGCYVYSRLQKDTTVKLGMSEAGLFRRVKQAKSCFPFPDEFWLQMLIITLDMSRGKGSSTRQIENALLAEAKLMKTIQVVSEETKEVDAEGELVERKEQGIRPREYRFVSERKNLNLSVEKVLNSVRVWNYVVVFSPKGWVIINNDGSSKPINEKNRSSLWARNDKFEQRPEIGKVVSTKVDVFIPEVLKIGDGCYVIQDKADDGTASFKPSGKAVVSSKGFIVGKTKNKKQWMISWDNFRGKKYHGNFNFNEVYITKADALIAKKKHYD